LVALHVEVVLELRPQRGDRLVLGLVQFVMLGLAGFVPSFARANTWRGAIGRRSVLRVSMMVRAQLLRTTVSPESEVDSRVNSRRCFADDGLTLVGLCALAAHHRASDWLPPDTARRRA